MSKILFVSHQIPRTMSSGGEHRTYQILCDLEKVVGKGNVTLFDPRQSPVNSTGRRQSPVKVPWRFKNLIKRLGEMRENAFQVFLETGFSMNKFAFRGHVERYEAALRQTQPALCVIQHAACAWMVPINRRSGIQTIACPQNLDSVDQGLPVNHRWYLPAALGDLANEIAGLGSCDHRLMISKVETATLEGLGYPSQFYPYRPIDEIKDFFAEIRRCRNTQPQEEGLFLLLGSASHQPIRHGMLWFLNQVEQYGLPESIRIVGIGNGTDKLLPAGKRLPGVELMGFVEQTELERLLVTAKGVLLPKFRGFGSVTRLPEMSCAGIPSIASEHISYAVNIPPNVWPVSYEWDSWLKAINGVAEKAVSEPENYEVWHENQPSTLETLAKAIIT